MAAAEFCYEFQLKRQIHSLAPTAHSPVQAKSASLTKHGCIFNCDIIFGAEEIKRNHFSKVFGVGWQHNLVENFRYWYRNSKPKSFWNGFWLMKFKVFSFLVAEEKKLYRSWLKSLVGQTLCMKSFDCIILFWGLSTFKKKKKN